MQSHFIGIMLRGSLVEKLEECRAYMKRVYGCKSGHRTPMHVTLVPPFSLQEGASTRDLFDALSARFESPKNKGVVENVSRKGSGIYSDGDSSGRCYPSGFGDSGDFGGKSSGTYNGGNTGGSGGSGYSDGFDDECSGIYASDSSLVRCYPSGFGDTGDFGEKSSGTCHTGNTGGPDGSGYSDGEGSGLCRSGSSGSCSDPKTFGSDSFDSAGGRGSRICDADDSCGSIRKATSFIAKIRGFEAFQDRTIYARVLLDKKWDVLKAETVRAVRGYLPARISADKRPFRPHATIANRDIPPGATPEALSVLNALCIEGSFPVDAITVFEREGQLWVPAAEIPVAD